jgi:hypothetical protein
MQREIHGVARRRLGQRMKMRAQRRMPLDGHELGKRPPHQLDGIGTQ